MRLHLNRNGRWIFLLASALFFSGCMKVGPDFIRPRASVAPNWIESGDERVKTAPAEYRAWWSAFNDPVLDRIIERAYRENLSLKQAGVRVLEARAQLGVAVGNLYPQTQQLSGSLLHIRGSERGAAAAAAQSQQSGGQTGGSGNDDQGGGSGNQSRSSGKGTQVGYLQDQVNFNAAWEIDFWGKFRRAVESADATLRSTVADYDSALVSLTADTANNYVQIRTLRNRLNIARENAETQKESVRIADAKFQGGTTSERDYDQAKTILANTLATIPALEIQLRQTENALCVLLGLPPCDLSEMLGESSDIPAPAPQVAIGIPADLLRRRPDVRSAELLAAAQCAQIGVARADLFPAFSLTGAIGVLSTDVGKFSLEDIASAKARNIQAGPTFQWNILNYGRITDNVRVQDARFQQLLIAYRNTVLTAQREVEDSLAGFLRSQQKAEYLAQSADAANRSVQLAMIQYRAGSTDFTTVLTAQQSLLASQDSFASALGDISTNLVGVYRALGGGWEIREEKDVVSPEIKEAMARRTNWGKLLSTSAHLPPPGPEPDIRPPDW